MVEFVGRMDRYNYDNTLVLESDCKHTQKQQSLDHTILNIPKTKIKCEKVTIKSATPQLKIRRGADVVQAS
jgi:hypothetical protein